MARWVGVVVLMCACSNAQMAATPDLSGSGDAGATAATQPADAGAVAAQPQPELLDPAAIHLFAVSPCGDAALVSHHGSFSRIFTGDAVLVRRRQPAVTLASDNVAAGSFSADCSLVIHVGLEGSGFARTSDGAPPPGVVLSKNAIVNMASRWLYWTASDGQRWHAYRMTIPAGEPQVLASGASPPPLFTDVSVMPLGNGDAYIAGGADFSAPAQLVRPELPAPISLPLPSDGFAASPDGRWVATKDCLLFDAEGNSRRLCQTTDFTRPFPVFSDDNSHVAAASDNSIQVLDLRTMSTTVLPAPALHPDLTLTPDGSRIIATTRAIQPTTSAWIASTAGGPWMTLSEDVSEPGPDARSGVVVSPDSRIVAANSTAARGAVLSIAGAAPFAVAGLANSFAATPVFEPPGGRDRAIFWTVTPDGFLRTAIGNADGSGDFVDMPAVGNDWYRLLAYTEYPTWTGHNVFSPVNVRTGGSDAVFDLYVTPDDGAQAPVATGIVLPFAVNEIDRKTTAYYVVPGQGLFSKLVPEAAP